MTTTASTPEVPRHPALKERIVPGALAGLGGGILFGMMMAMMDMLTSVAGLIGLNSAVAGAVLHLVISAVLGALFAAVIPTQRVGPLVGWGVMYGVILWLVGSQLLMPVRLGLPMMQMGMTGMQKLMGHLVFGVVTALALWQLRRRAAR